MAAIFKWLLVALDCRPTFEMQIVFSSIIRNKAIFCVGTRLRSGALTMVYRKLLTLRVVGDKISGNVRIINV